MESNSLSSWQLICTGCFVSSCILPWQHKLLLITGYLPERGAKETSSTQSHGLWYRYWLLNYGLGRGTLLAMHVLCQGVETDCTEVKFRSIRQNNMIRFNNSKFWVLVLSLQSPPPPSLSLFPCTLNPPINWFPQTGHRGGAPVPQPPASL